MPAAGQPGVLAGAPTHEQHEREGHPWARMDARFSIRHLIAPMRSLAQQCAVPPGNLVRLLETLTLHVLRKAPDKEGKVPLSQAHRCRPLVCAY